MARRDADVIVLDSDGEESADPPEDEESKKKRLAEAEARKAQAAARKRRVKFWIKNWNMSLTIDPMQALRLNYMIAE
jgi:hypothetical protein